MSPHTHLQPDTQPVDKPISNPSIGSGRWEMNHLIERCHQASLLVCVAAMGFCWSQSVSVLRAPSLQSVVSAAGRVGESVVVGAAAVLQTIGGWTAETVMDEPLWSCSESWNDQLVIWDIRALGCSKAHLPPI